MPYFIHYSVPSGIIRMKGQPAVEPIYSFISTSMCIKISLNFYQSQKQSYHPLRASRQTLNIILGALLFSVPNFAFSTDREKRKRHWISQISQQSNFFRICFRFTNFSPFAIRSFPYKKIQHKWRQIFWKQIIVISLPSFADKLFTSLQIRNLCRCLYYYITSK